MKYPRSALYACLGISGCFIGQSGIAYVNSLCGQTTVTPYHVSECRSFRLQVVSPTLSSIRLHIKSIASQTIYTFLYSSLKKLQNAAGFEMDFVIYLPFP